MRRCFGSRKYSVLRLIASRTSWLATSVADDLVWLVPLITYAVIPSVEHCLELLNFRYACAMSDCTFDTDGLCKVTVLLPPVLLSSSFHHLPTYLLSSIELYLLLILKRRPDSLRSCDSALPNSPASSLSTAPALTITLYVYVGMRQFRQKLAAITASPSRIPTARLRESSSLRNKP